MRVTNKMIFSQTDLGMFKAQEDLLDAHEKVVTGKGVLKPSDDPAAANRVLGYRTVISRIEQHGRNVNSVQARLESTESALSSAGNVIQRLKELATAQANGSLSPEERKTGAAEVRQLFEEMVAAANTKSESGYIFAGYATDTAPFDINGNTSGNIGGEIRIEIENGMTVSANVTGDKVFKGTGGGVDVFAAINGLLSSLDSNDAAGIQTAICNMDKALDQIIKARTDVGARLARIDLVKGRLEDVKLVTTNALSDEEDIDIAKAISDFTAKQQALEAARASAAKIFQMPTLMDFLK